MADMQQMASGIVTFIVAAIVGVIVISAMWSGTGIYDSDLDVEVVDGTNTSVPAGNTLKVYYADNDTLAAQNDTNSNGYANFTDLLGEETYYLNYNGTNSSNITLDNSTQEIRYDHVTPAVYDISSSDEQYRSVFVSIESTVGNIYSILLVLPIVAVGAAAIGMLNRRLNRGRR